MGIAILCMVNHTWIENRHVSPLQSKIVSNFTEDSNDKTCHLAEKNSTLTDGPFLWPKKTQGMVLSAFFYGYFFTQVNFSNFFN